MRIEALPPIVDRLVGNLSYPGVAQELADALIRQAGAAACRVWVTDAGDRCHVCELRSECRDQTRCLHLAASSGCDVGDEAARLRIPLGVQAVGQVAATRAPFICHQPGSDPRLPDTAALQTADIACCSAWPLVYAERTIGVLAVYACQSLGDADLQKLAVLAQRCASAIANARSVEELRRRVGWLEQHNHMLARELLLARHHQHILGTSPAIQALRDRISVLAARPDPLLITGPVGAGKELAARALHAHGAARRYPFLQIDCRSVPGEHLACELFGHDVTTSLGASMPRPGLLESADQGVLFLKHADHLPETIAARLVQAIHEGRARRPGDETAYPVRVRVVASMTDAGRAAADCNPLVACLARVSLNVPPLIERRQDIPLLVEHSVRRFARLYDRHVAAPSPVEMERLQAYDWPGNVRELVQVCERAVLVSEPGTLRFEQALEPRRGEAGGRQLLLASVEREHICRVLRLTRGVIQGPAGAAALLGLRPSTLRSRMARLGIPRRQV